MNKNRLPARLTLVLSLIVVTPLLVCGDAQKDYNAYVSGSFPGQVSGRVFEIPLDPAGLLVVIPPGLEAKKATLESSLSQKAGQPIPVRGAGALQAGDLRGKNLILVGNIMNNSWLLEMCMKRRAFADAYFPGAGGVFIHPAKSVWDPARNVLVIGASREEDLEKSFSAFLDQIRPGAKSIGAVHVLQTAHEIPAPPESVEPTFGAVRKDIKERPAYRAIAQWGFTYFLTGEKQWAALFRDGMEVLLERAKKSGKWITEPWSNVYFALWNIFGAWTLIDDDPVFAAEDRRTIEEVLWGYTRYIQARPYLDEDRMPLYEPRQNHYTFLALSLDAAYRYYTEKYGLTGLDAMADKVKRCFDLGQAMSYRPNDDGGSGYQVLAPSHYLYYALAKGDLSFMESGRLRTLVDLMVATIDNRGDPVTFGDIGGYSHRRPGRLQMKEMQFLSLAAWFYREGAYQWLYNWLGEGTRIDLDPWGPLGLGLYATDIKEAPPDRFLGILPVLLDEASLRWSARRPESASQLPAAGRQYFDKISFRRSLDPQDEYLLLDGTSTFAHGHEDGNTVTRLTWKDRVWLADLHYIKAGPQEHNGVVVVRNGTQEAPPPLTELERADEFDTAGLTLTTIRDYNGADWQRHIFWRKGRYFLFLDRVVARKSGDYRLENRWRLLGDVRLEGTTTTVRQGEMCFRIKSADSAARFLQVVPDEHNGDWDYPYGPDATIVNLAKKKTAMTAGSSWIFANLMFAAEGDAPVPMDLLRAGEDLYAVDDPEGREFIGLSPATLWALGIAADCAVFAQTPERLFLFGLTRLKWGRGDLVAPSGVSLDINRKDGSAVMLVPREGEVLFGGIELKGSALPAAGSRVSARLSPGEYELKFGPGVPFAQGLDDFYSGSAAAILPDPVEAGPADFGLEAVRRVESGGEITAACSDGETLVWGTAAGTVFRVDGGGVQPLFEVPDGKKILALAAADLDGDGRKEFVSSDDAENLFCHDETGGLLWRLKAQKYFGRDANVTDIWIDDIDGKGNPTILAATNGWKLYAVRPDGTVRWESFIFYHPLTKVRVLKNKDKISIAVGTVYQTPFNLVDPATGVVIWKTWEQTGSETMSTTDYCGKHLRDMVFADTDGDGMKEIVFGNEYHSIYALDAADGAIKWKAQVGDKVSAMKLLQDGAGGGERILAATEAGEVYILDRRQGRRLGMTSLDSGITGMEIISGADQGRKEILLSTADGRVAILDRGLLPKAALQTGLGAILGIYPAGKSGNRQKFYAVGKKEIAEILYVPVFLRPSRHY
jgi:outer membrane protein assembly factor BamB